MKLLEKIKRFWIRSILRRVYDSDEIFENEIPFEKMNHKETALIIGMLYSEISNLQDDMMGITEYVSHIPTPCDKCSNYENPGLYCVKCDGSGIIENKRLCDWPW